MTLKSFSPRADAALDAAPLADHGSVLGWRSVLGIVVAGAFVLLCASVFQDLRLYAGPNPDLAAKVWLLDVDVEQSFFTWLSVVALFVVAQLLFRAAGEPRNARFRWHWLVLAGLFLFVSVDEFTGLHEKLSQALASRTAHTGLMYFVWAAPAGLISLAGLAAFIPFIRSFPPRLAVLAMLSAGLYLGGAVVMEMIGGSVAEVAGVESLRYRLFANIEEGLELAGTLLFIYVLLSLRERSAWPGRAVRTA